MPKVCLSKGCKCQSLVPGSAYCHYHYNVRQYGKDLANLIRNSTKRAGKPMSFNREKYFELEFKKRG